LVMEYFGCCTSANVSLDGIVIASSSSSNNKILSFGIFPGGMTTLLPRFAFETLDDQSILDSGNYNCGAIVECIQLQEEDCVEEEEAMYKNALVTAGGGNGRLNCDIVMDPVKNGMLHVVSSKGIFTVTTNVLSVYAHNIAQDVEYNSNTSATPSFMRQQQQQQKKTLEVQTNAWSCLEVSGGSGVEDEEIYSRDYGTPAKSGTGGRVSLSGVVVSGDAHLGHVLVATLSNGTMEAVNITAAQYLHEASVLDASTSLTEPKTNNKAVIESDKALKVMQSMQPLHEQLKPLMTKVVASLSTMGKIVGGQTKPSEANASSIATFISTKEKCEQDIVLPLQEMNELSSNRMNVLKDMHAHQEKQVQQLKNMIDTLRQRMKVTSEKKMIAESNANVLAQRSAAVLAASRDLLPTITEAEREYFGQLKRYEMNVHKWESAFQDVQNKCTTLCDGMDPNITSCKVNLNEEHIAQCFDLLGAEGKLLKKHGKKIEKVESMMKELVVSSGFEENE